MTQRQLILLAAGGSAALLAGAFAFQMLGYPPCALCLWQRWPHAAAVAIGVLALGFGARGLLPRALALLGAAAAAVTAGIGLYHTGVERGWWEGPSSCTSAGGGLGGLSGGALLPGTEIAPVVMCDEVAWQLFGISMASWNAAISLALAGLWILAATARAR